MNTDEAVRRVKLIVEALLADVGAAVTTHVTMETLNETIPAALGNQPANPAYTFNAIQGALTQKVAMDIARIFDVTEGGRFLVEEQDKASIPVLAALFARDDVKGALLEAARHWTPAAEKEQMAACRRAVAGFIRIAQLFQTGGTKEREAFGRIREYRTKRLAHYLFDKQPNVLPFYRDLALLISVATKAVKLAALAVNGNIIDPRMWIDHDRDEAKQFCLTFIAGVNVEVRAD